MFSGDSRLMQKVNVSVQEVGKQKGELALFS